MVILLEPVHVESFVFSTFPKPTSAFVSARKLGAPFAVAGAASTYLAVLLAYGFLVSPYPSANEIVVFKVVLCAVLTLDTTGLVACTLTLVTVPEVVV